MWCPIGERVFVKPDAPKKETESGIVIPAVAQEKTWAGEVVAVGEDVKNPRIVRGARVLVSKYGGLELPGTEMMSFLEDEILAVDDGGRTL